MRDRSSAIVFFLPLTLYVDDMRPTITLSLCINVGFKSAESLFNVQTYWPDTWRGSKLSLYS